MAHRQNLLDTSSREGDCTGQLRFTSRDAGNSPAVQSTDPWGSSPKCKTGSGKAKKLHMAWDWVAGLVRRTASSRKGMAEDELVRTTVFGERGSFKSVDSALLLPVSSEFWAKIGNAILRITCKLNMQGCWALSNGCQADRWVLFLILPNSGYPWEPVFLSVLSYLESIKNKLALTITYMHCTFETHRHTCKSA